MCREGCSRQQSAGCHGQGRAQGHMGSTHSGYPWVYEGRTSALVPWHSHKRTGAMAHPQAHWCHGTATSALVPWHSRPHVSMMNLRYTRPPSPPAPLLQSLEALLWHIQDSEGVRTLHCMPQHAPASPPACPPACPLPLRRCQSYSGAAATHSIADNISGMWHASITTSGVCGYAQQAKLTAVWPCGRPAVLQKSLLEDAVNPSYNMPCSKARSMACPMATSKSR